MDITKTINDINEKIGWATRSLHRLQDAAGNHDVVGVQDHFWSFLHASQLLWFYVGRYFQANGRAKESAKGFFKRWLIDCLHSEQAAIWDVINRLRVADAHIEPVVTEETKESRLLVRGTRLLCRNGKLLVRSSTRFFVTFESVQYECDSLATEWLSLAQQFVDYFGDNGGQFKQP